MAFIGKLGKNFKSIYFTIVRSIAFIPSFISLGLIILAFILINLESKILGSDGLTLLSWIRIQNTSQAGTILTTLLAGTLSLTVFSFSMVMVVLNQASMNFTPKILGQIVSNRRNQVVLGFYIGTIIYLIIILVNLAKGDTGLKVPEIAFLVGTALSVGNLALFVYFIHFISMEIQVKNIIRMIYFNTSDKIDALNKNEPPKQNKEIAAIIEHHEWVTYLSADSGYLQNYASELATYLQEQDLLLKMEMPMTRFVLKGNPIFSLSKKVEKEVKEKIENYLFFYPDEVVEDNVLYGFRQIMEIAVKALSPGINDPGTANVCIEYLSSLCAKRSRLPDVAYACDKTGHIRIIALPIRYEEILHVSFAPIRNYGSKDLSILERLMMSFKELSYQDKEEKKFKELYHKHTKAIIASADKSLVNEIDRQHFNNIIAHMNYHNTLYYTLPTLEADSR